MTTPQSRLEALVEAFRAKRLDLTGFQREYSACYADENADAGFTPEQVDFYGTIHEKAEWTTAAPSSEARSYGWLDEDGFRAWLEAHLRHRP